VVALERVWLRQFSRAKKREETVDKTIHELREQVRSALARLAQQGGVPIKATTPANPAVVRISPPDGLKSDGETLLHLR
jgi:hypothetical protein